MIKDVRHKGYKMKIFTGPHFPKTGFTEIMLGIDLPYPLDFFSMEVEITQCHLWIFTFVYSILTTFTNTFLKIFMN